QSIISQQTTKVSGETTIKKKFETSPISPGGISGSSQPPSLQSTVPINELNTNYEQLDYDAASHMAAFLMFIKYSIMYHHTSIIPKIPPRHYHNQLVPNDEQLSLAEKRELALQLQKIVPKQPQIHKMAILQDAIDYICYLEGLLAEKRKLKNNNSNNDNKDDGRFVKKTKLDSHDNTNYNCNSDFSKINNYTYDNDNCSYMYSQSINFERNSNQ
ncbi:10235_t:CDS:2, partial [Ambispora leptoticha]